MIWEQTVVELPRPAAADPRRPVVTAAILEGYVDLEREPADRLPKPRRFAPAAAKLGVRLLPPTEYLPFVRRIAVRIARRLPSHVDLEDLIGAGVVGLLECMNRFDPEREKSFEQFAEFRIKGSILDELRRRDLMARDARVESRHLADAIRQVAQNLGREPEQEDVAAHLGLTVEALQQRLEKLGPVQVISRDDLNEDEGLAHEETAYDVVSRRELLGRMELAITKLKLRHRQVLRLYYNEGLTLKEIGNLIEVTESRVSQLLTEATLRLRVLLGREGSVAEGDTL